MGKPFYEIDVFLLPFPLHCLYFYISYRNKNMPVQRGNSWYDDIKRALPFCISKQVHVCICMYMCEYMYKHGCRCDTVTMWVNLKEV